MCQEIRFVIILGLGRCFLLKLEFCWLDLRKHVLIMYYHLTSNHALKSLLFKDDEDRLFFVNRLAMLAILLNVRIYAYCLMDNHIHLLVEGDEEVIRLFFTKLRREYSQYLSQKYGDNACISEFLPEMKVITSRFYFQSAVAYILRNPLKAGISCPYSYAWSSSWIYFRQQFWGKNEKTVKEIGTVNVRHMLHTRGRVLDNLTFCDGIISPRHWVLYSKVESLFGTSCDLFKAVSKWNMENEMESYLLDKEICSYPDSYLMNVIKGYCDDFGVDSVSSLDTLAFRKLISRLGKQYGSPRKQIARLTGADDDTIVRFS